MIGLDTNILVRYLTQDDPSQSPKANALIESLSEDRPGFISQVALVELVWVLSRAYRQGKPELLRVLRTLLQTRALQVENPDQVAKALRLFEQGKADFSDCLLGQACLAAGCSRTLSFDAAALHAGMEVIA